MTTFYSVPRIMKIHKNLSVDISNIFPYQHFILSFSQIIFCMVATLMVHPGTMKIHKNLPGSIPNIFPYQNMILSLRNCIHNNFLYDGHPNGTP